MKEFRKAKDDLFVCEECLRTFTSYQGLRNHIRHSHKNLSQKDYYNKWLKEERDEKCKICNSDTKFISLLNGYKECCCTKHTNLYAYQKKAKTMKEKYGYENQYQRNDVKEKSKKTMIKKYGVDNPRKSKKFIEKGKETCLKKYGNENYNNSEKRKETCLNKYGVEHPYQLESIFLKHLKSRRLIKQYKDTNLTYQSSYELDFLEKFYNKIDIEKGPSISYLYNNQNKIYHSDFYIPSKNLIVEIKSSYILSLDIQISEKKKACLDQGYNYILILDKKYDNSILTS